MGARRVALCIPWHGEAIPLVYWYGVLASVGIFVGAWYASKHLESEGEDPDIVWDALLWLLIPALLGARLWYVLAEVMGGSTRYSFSDPIGIINPRDGGMNIFGGAIFGLVALLIYARSKKVDGWLLADGGLMGLLLGQGIGRIGNFINIELYGPPTGSSWFGMKVPAAYRYLEFSNLPEETRFHPTMFYESFWLFLVFGVLYYLFRRYQSQIVHGIMAGAYLTLAGFGRFILEFWRPDQPELTPGVSYSRILAMAYVVIGIIILLDRSGNLRIPFIARPQTPRQRQKAYEEVLTQRRRLEQARERERLREQRRKERKSRAQQEQSQQASEQQ
jgi:phosphatidylglycerol:prolipoprotein diacylglycerol transferase